MYNVDGSELEPPMNPLFLESHVEEVIYEDTAYGFIPKNVEINLRCHDAISRRLCDSSRIAQSLACFVMISDCLAYNEQGES